MANPNRVWVQIAEVIFVNTSLTQNSQNTQENAQYQVFVYTSVMCTCIDIFRRICLLHTSQH